MSASTAPTWANVATPLIVLMMSWPNVSTSGSGHDRVAQPPAGHRVRLGEAVEHDRPLGHARQRGDRDVLGAVVHDAAVDLVGEDPQVVRDRPARRSARGRSRVSTPPVGLAGELMTRSRVRGVISEASSSTSSRKSFAIRIGIGTGVAADEAGHRLVDRVARVRDDDLVARVDEAEDRVQHHALAADRHEDLERLDREALARRGVGGDRLAQRGMPGERRVVGRAGVERAPWPPRGRWPACRSPARRSGGGRSSGPAPRAPGRAPRPRTRSRCRWCPSGRRCASSDLRSGQHLAKDEPARSRGARRAAACTTDTSAHRRR